MNLFENFELVTGSNRLYLIHSAFMEIQLNLCTIVSELQSQNLNFKDFIPQSLHSVKIKNDMISVIFHQLKACPLSKGD